MKKIYALFLGLGMLNTAIAQDQIANSGFETWENEPYNNIFYEKPASWEPGSFCANIGESSVCEVSAFKSTDANSGNYALKFDASTGFGLVFSDLHTVIGSNRPLSFNVMVKSNIAAGETVSITAYLHNAESTFELEESAIIGIAEIEINSSNNTYTKLSANIVYTSSASYKYITVIINSDGESSTLIADDVTFVYNQATSVISKINKSIISPTVVSNDLVFNEQIEKFEILNTNGSTVLNGTSQVANVSNLSQGMYIVKAVKADGSVVTYRIVKK